MTMNACGQVLYDRKMHFTNRISDACIYVNTRTLVFHDVYSKLNEYLYVTIKGFMTLGLIIIIRRNR